MNRKIVALLLAVMLVASSVAAFAAYPEYNGTTATGKYVISADGIWMIVTNAAGEQEVIAVNYDVKYVKDFNAEIVAAGLTFIGMWNNQWVCTNAAGNVVVLALSGEYDKGAADSTIENIITTGPDAYDHHYTDYDINGTKLVKSVKFAPVSFGDGLNFDHSAAKRLFTINVAYDSNAWIQIRDDEGRLYPVAGATYVPAKNGYTLTLKAGENTISWYGADGAGWHKAGSASSAATIALDVNMTLETVAKDLDGKSFYNDKVDIRFDYIVKHSVANHAVADASASAPKTGDAGMAYMTLAALIVMMGAAVVVTRKVRNF